MKHLPWLVAGSIAGVVLAVVTLLLGLEAPSRLQMFVGRLHPLAVHLPIGFLVLAGLLEGLSRVRRFRRLRPAIPLVLALSAASALVAVLAGYLLATTGGYDGPAITWHKRLGIGVAAGAMAALVLWYAARLSPGAWVRRAYTGTLFATLVMLLAAGHLGSTLTHGPDHLTEYMPEPMLAVLRLLPARTPAPLVAHRDDVDAYQHLVQPVLQARCVSCHGPARQSGGLRLDSRDGIREGGDTGPAVVAGDAAQSEILRRIWLPQEHEEHMPPRGRKPLTIAEAELLRWWVEQGGPFDQRVDETEAPRVVLEILEQVAGPRDVRRPPVLRRQVAPVDPAALRKARDLGLLIQPLSRTNDFLHVHCGSGTETCGSAQVEALELLSQQIASLDLSRAQIGDQDLATIGRLPHLTRLRLDGTAITDAGLAHLARLEHLEYLNLYGTAVTDAGLPSLANLENLRSIYLWQTGVSPAGAERLKQSLARIDVHLGLSRTAIDSLRRTERAVPPAEPAY